MKTKRHILKKNWEKNHTFRCRQHCRRHPRHFVICAIAVYHGGDLTLMTLGHFPNSFLPYVPLYVLFSPETPFASLSSRWTYCPPIQGQISLTSWEEVPSPLLGGDWTNSEVLRPGSASESGGELIPTSRDRLPDPQSPGQGPGISVANTDYCVA